MQFNSVIFVFFFLPVVILVNTLLKTPRLRKLWVLLTSMFFYGWCSTRNLLFLLLYGLVNYGLLRLIAKYRRKGLLALTVLADVGILVIFKYLGFITTTCNSLFGSALTAPDLFFPLGISFLTFSAISCAVDVYRDAEDHSLHMAAYFFYLGFFPKVAQGPIARMSELTYLPSGKVHLSEFFFVGLKRFVIGLAKKCLIADVLGQTVDLVCGNLLSGISCGTAWVGMLFYTFQIYYDFAGYSDMAIGIGNMLGFSLPENFRTPYLSKSVSEFWRRWHMTLGIWFREYIYIPLGGNRKGGLRTIRNLAVVWILTGIWHGASFNFIVWGCYYGILVIFEKLIAKKHWYVSIPTGVKWAGTFLAVMIGWVIFRTETLPEAVIYLRTLLGWGQHGTLLYGFRYYFDVPGLLALGLAILAALPRPKWLQGAQERSTAAYIAVNVGVVLLFLISVVYMINSTYSAFIYFQF